MPAPIALGAGACSILAVHHVWSSAEGGGEVTVVA